MVPTQLLCQWRSRPIQRCTPDQWPTGREYTAVTGENAAEITIDLTPRPEPYVISFAITTVARDGLQSVLSNTVSKTFDVKSTAKPNAPTSVTFTVVCGDGCSITEVGAN